MLGMQELRMLSSVTINCQVTKIVMNPGSQLSVLQSVSQMSQVPMIAPLGYSLTEVHGRYVGREVIVGQIMSFRHSDQMSQRSQVSRIAPFWW